MSLPQEVQDAYQNGLDEGGLLGHKNGMIAAYLDMQQAAMDRLRAAPRYTDTRVASEMLDLCNDRLAALNDGTVPGSLKVTVVPDIDLDLGYAEATEHGIPMPKPKEVTEDGS